MSTIVNSTTNTIPTQENPIPSAATVATYAKTELVMQWNIVNGKLVSEWNFKSN